MSNETVYEFNIEGQPVSCHDGDRLWRCDCTYFHRTLAQYGQGFGPHVAADIEMAIHQGRIDFSSSLQRAVRKASGERPMS